MRARLSFLTISLVSLTLATSAATADVSRTLCLEYEPGASETFAVENLAGTMRILPGSGSRVEATATIHAEDNTLLDSISFELVSGEGGVPTLRVVYPVDEYSTFRYGGGRDAGWFESWFGSNDMTTAKYAGRRVKVSSRLGVEVYAEIEVLVPDRIHATFRNVAGDVLAEGLHGELKFDTVSGQIKISDLRGSIIADTGSGDVNASDIRGDFNGDTGSGDILLERLEGDRVRLDTGSGDIIAKELRAFKLVADTGSGDIDIDGVEVEELVGDTGSGNIQLGITGTSVARIHADTGSGDVTVILQEDASFEARADIGAGDIENYFTDAEPILRRRELVGWRRGDGRTRILVDTGTGDFILRPAR